MRKLFSHGERKEFSMNKAAAILLGVAMSVSICGTSLAAGPDYRSGTPWPASNSGKAEAGWLP